MIRAANVVSFNLGVEQKMLTSNAHLENMRACVERLAAAQQLDFICLCELGGYRDGLAGAHKNASDITRGVLPHAMVAVAGAYACLWNTNPERQSTLISKGVVECSQDKRADMMWLQFGVSNSASPGGAFQPAEEQPVAGVVIGILHIISSRNSKTTLGQRKTIVQEALGILETRKRECQDKLDGVPVGAFLVGDFNISLVECHDAAARANSRHGRSDPRTVWKAVAATHSLSDVAIAAGGESSSFVVPVGKTYPGTAVRKDAHDAVGVRVEIHGGALQPAGAGVSSTRPRAPQQPGALNETMPWPFYSGTPTLSAPGRLSQRGLPAPAAEVDTASPSQGDPGPQPVHSTGTPTATPASTAPAAASAPDGGAAQPARDAAQQRAAAVQADSAGVQPDHRDASVGGEAALAPQQRAAAVQAATAGAHADPQDALDGGEAALAPSLGGAPRTAQTATTSTPDGGARQPASEPVQSLATAVQQAGSASASAPGPAPAAGGSATPVPSGAGAPPPPQVATPAETTSGTGQTASTSTPDGGALQPAGETVQQRADAIQAAMHHARDLAEDDEPPAHAWILQAIAAMLYMKRKVHVGDQVFNVIASPEQTRETIQALLERRHAFLRAENIANPDTVLENDQRKRLMDTWKQEFHDRPEQRQQQIRDSWEGHPDARDDQEGPNKARRHKGMHSRFSRMIQLEAGNKLMAELILYTGRYDVNFLQQAAREWEARGGATQPADEGQKQRKARAIHARWNERYAIHLRQEIDRGRMREADVGPWKRRLLEDLRSGRLTQERDEATKAHGHGVTHDEDGNEIQLGFFTSIASHMLDARRFAPDGRAYTYAEFVEYYGHDVGHAVWTNAQVVAAD